MRTTQLPGSRLLVGAFMLSMSLPALALAQDSDGDGVADAADAFPCDPTRASVSYFPGQGTSALLAFEDQWPSSTDLDFNDVVVRVHYRLERNAAGDVVQLHGVIDPVALGGALSNGLGLQLPASRTGVTARRRVGGGAWESLAFESDPNVTLVVSPNLRELYGSAGGRINSIAGATWLDGQRIELEVTFSPPAALSVASAPFDVFVFRAGDFGHQIHFPQFSGTAAMRSSLFNSEQDASTASRRFVHLSGVPAALNLMTTTRYPLEGVQVSALFPDITSFALSGGATHTGFYSSNVVAAQGHQITAPALPAVPAPSTACISLGTSPSTPGATCRTLQQSGGTTSGVYWIDPDGSGGDPAYQVYCDQTTAGGGWTVFQRRTNGSVDFYRVLADYRNGFGSPSTEYWVGLERMRRFTQLRTSTLRIDLRHGAQQRHAAYSTFAIGTEASGYVLSAGGYSGDAGDSLTYHSGSAFSTRDADRDSWSSHCAQSFTGAWWYHSCHYSNLNGMWGNTSYAQGPVWYHWLGHYAPMTFTQMAMREL